MEMCGLLEPADNFIFETNLTTRLAIVGDQMYEFVRELGRCAAVT